MKFERIHPFQDGNGRAGRLIMFKECLKYGIVPFIIENKIKCSAAEALKNGSGKGADLPIPAFLRRISSSSIRIISE